jgi:hypothetical protein
MLTALGSSTSTVSYGMSNTFAHSSSASRSTNVPIATTSSLLVHNPRFRTSAREESTTAFCVEKTTWTRMRLLTLMGGLRKSKSVPRAQEILRKARVKEALRFESRIGCILGTAHGSEQIEGFTWVIGRMDTSTIRDMMKIDTGFGRVTGVGIDSTAIDE